MSEDKLYELRQDISTPAYYIRAGRRATEKQWKAKLGEFTIEFASEWFYDLSEKEEDKVDELGELIDSVFRNNSLNSLSYKEAARHIAEEWLKQNQKP